jgi:hypothetical protein
MPDIELYRHLLALESPWTVERGVSPDDTKDVDKLIIRPPYTLVYRTIGDSRFRANRRYSPLR